MEKFHQEFRELGSRSIFEPFHIIRFEGQHFLQALGICGTLKDPFSADHFHQGDTERKQISVSLITLERFGESS